MTITQETFTWPFKDADWKNKFIIGSVLVFAGSLIPLIGLLGIFVVYGYALIVMRTVMRGEAPTLPKWDRFGELFLDGLKAILSLVGYLIPGILAFICAYASIFIPIFSGVIFSAGNIRAPGTTFLPFFVVGEFAFILFFFLGFGLFLIGLIPTPVAVGQYARTGQIRSGYHVREIWRILRVNALGFLMAWIIYVGLGYITSFAMIFVYATILLCFFLPVILAPITFYTTLLYATIFGMAFREAAMKVNLQSSPA